MLEAGEMFKMNEEFDSSTKYRDIYKTLIKLDAPIGELDLPVSIYNFLYRNGIHNVQQLLEMSPDDLMNIEAHSGSQGRIIENIVYIDYKLRQLSDSQNIET